MYANGSAPSEQSHSPRSSITGVTSSKTASGGVDWLGVSCWIGWSVAAHERFVGALSDALARAEESGEIEPVDGLPCDDLVAVKPFAGKSRGMKYQIQWQGMKLDFSASRVAMESSPNCSVNIPSTVLMVAGHQQAWAMVKDFIGALGGELIRTNVKRVDLCVDLAGVDIAPFIDHRHSGSYVCRAQDEVLYTHHKRVTGWELGKRVRCRIYDKAFEVVQDDDKKQIMREKRWGQDEVFATRVEFQLRTEILKDRGCGGEVERVFEKLPLLCDWLTSKWLRLTDGVVDREGKNQSKRSMSDLWQLVKDYFQEWAGKNVDSFVTPVKRCRASGKMLRKQAAGCLATLFVKQRSEGADVREFLIEVFEEFIPEIETREPDRRARERLSWAVCPADDLEGVPF